MSVAYDKDFLCLSEFDESMFPSTPIRPLVEILNLDFLP